MARFVDRLGDSDQKARTKVLWAMWVTRLEVPAAARAIMELSVARLEELVVQDAAILLQSGGKLGVGTKDVAEKLLDRLLTCWEEPGAGGALFEASRPLDLTPIRAASMTFQGLMLSGYEVLPPAAEPLVWWFVERLPDSNVHDCETAIRGLAVLLDGSDTRLQSIVERYSEFVGLRTPKQRELVHTALDAGGFADKKLLGAIW